MKHEFLSWDSNFFGFNVSAARIAEQNEKEIEYGHFRCL